MKHLIIEGFIGSGKGACARMLGKELKLPVIDVDKVVSERLNMTTADIYDRFGEIFYRAEETLVLSDLVNEKKKAIIVLGSGVAMMPQNEKILEELGTVIYIEVSQATVLRKMKGNRRHDWIKSDDWDERVLKLFREREPAYRKTADLIIEADSRKTEDIVREIIAALEEKGASRE